MAASPEFEAVPPRLIISIFVPFALGYFLSYLYRVVNAVIAPNLTGELGLSAESLGLLTGAYFLTFAAFQLPLGILLDRFGPRKTESVLLLFAASGAFLFASAGSLITLTFGRGLIGLGVSACLMAAFKAFVQWFPPQRLPLVNGLQLGAGGLGALAATAPVEAALQFTDWRGVFWFLGVLTLLVAGLIFMVVPEKQETHHASGIGLGTHVQGVLKVFSNPVFWHVVPWTVFSQATFLSIQGLWVGPWLSDVGGLDRESVAACLAWVAFAMVTGFILIGFVAERLARMGIRPVVVAASGMGVFMLVQCAVVLQWTEMVLPLWMLFGFFGTTGVVSYAVLSQEFPAQLAGRANTGLNLLVFVAAFIAQWGIGAIVNQWPAADGRGYGPAGYQVAFAVMLGLQVVSAVWFVRSGRRLVQGK